MEKVCIGEIVKPHGVKGEVKVKPFSDDLNNLTKQKKVFVNGEELAVNGARQSGGMVFYALEGVDRDRAERLKGGQVFIDIGSAAKLGADEYYIKDLLGCEVWADDTPVGRVTDIDGYGSADVYTVKDRGNDRVVRFPFLQSIIVDIDIAAKKITLDKKGFLQVCVYED